MTPVRASSRLQVLNIVHIQWLSQELNTRDGAIGTTENFLVRYFIIP